LMVSFLDDHHVKPCHRCHPDGRRLHEVPAGEFSPLNHSLPRVRRQKVRVLVTSEVVSAVFGGLVPGFLLGLLAFRVKSRWCPRCGASTHALPPPPERDR
jgi:hypothetical protein